MLRLYGQLSEEGASSVLPLLLPDTPVVVWWPSEPPAVPAKDPIGALAHRRITDSANDKSPTRALERLRTSYSSGDTDLAWTRLTRWRAYLAAALDLPPHEKVTAAQVVGEADSPSTDLLAAWLSTCLKIPVTRAKATYGEGIVEVRLERRSGNVELVRPDGKVGTLTQPGQPDRRIALHRRTVSDCLIEEMRRLDEDAIYDEALRGLSKVVRGRASTSTARRAAAARATAPANGKAQAKAAPRTAAKPAGTNKAGTNKAGTNKAGSNKAGSNNAGASNTGTDKAGANKAAAGSAKAAPRKARTTASTAAEAPAPASES